MGWRYGVWYCLLVSSKLWGRDLYSVRLANTHFWMATAGLLLYVTSMWTAGIVQAIMWFLTNEEGLLSYPNFLEIVINLVPLYWVRFIGGSLYMLGAVVCLYNVYMTAKLVKQQRVMLSTQVTGM